MLISCHEFLIQTMAICNEKNPQRTHSRKVVNLKERKSSGNQKKFNFL